MHTYITLKRIRILGAALHIHWSVFIATALILVFSFHQPVHAAIAVVCYLSTILLHEVGHAIFAKQLGYAPVSIYLTFIHGLCEYDAPDYLKEDATIAWGGVLAQLAVAVPLIFLSQVTPIATLPYFGIIIAFLGYLNLLVALMNLAPARGLDGALAWRLIPILVREARQRRSAKKARKAIIRRVK